jgi:hypothetical protein
MAKQENVPEAVVVEGQDVKKPLEDVEHAELAGYGDEVIMKSPFEDLGFRKTLVVFRKATLFALLAAFSAAAE